MLAVAPLQAESREGPMDAEKTAALMAKRVTLGRHLGLDERDENEKKI